MPVVPHAVVPMGHELPLHAAPSAWQYWVGLAQVAPAALSVTQH